MTTAEGMARMEAERVPCGVVYNPAELADDPHAQAIGLLVDDVHPIAGRIRQPRHPVLFDDTPARVGGPAPGARRRHRRRPRRARLRRPHPPTCASRRRRLASLAVDRGVSVGYDDAGPMDTPLLGFSHVQLHGQRRRRELRLVLDGARASSR